MGPVSRSTDTGTPARGRPAIGPPGAGEAGHPGAWLRAWLARGGWVWVAPAVAALAVHEEVADPHRLLVVALGAGLVTAAALRPGPVLVAVPLIYPLQLFLLAWAYKSGVSASTVRDLGYWIEAVAAGFGIRAVLRHLAHPPDGLDWAALAYLGVVAMYRLSPTLFVHAGTPPPLGGNVLDPALRNDALFVVFFLAVRHLGLTPVWRRRFAAAVLAAGVMVAAAGLYEFTASGSWNNFVVHSLGVPHYQVTILKGLIPSLTDVRVYTITAGHRILRIGSVFDDQLECAFFLTACLAIGCEWLTRLRRRSARALVSAATVLAGLGVLLTQTRDAILASGLVLVLAVRPLAGRSRQARSRLALLLVVAGLVLVPVAIKAGLGLRTTTALNGSDQSTQAHLSALSRGLSALAHQPLGRGLGTGGTNGLRFDVTNTLTSENQYLQIGNETGILSLAAFLALTVMAARGLWRAARSPDRVTAAAWRGAFAGLALAGLLLQVWLSLVAAVVVWTAVGLELAAEPAGEPGGAATTPATPDRVAG